MKTFITKSKSSLILIALIAFPAWAKPVAKVTELSGSVFVINGEGKTSTLKLNDHLEDKSEVMVEEGATITLSDFYDATYHLIGGTHLKFFDRSTQLKKGKTWIQSLNGRFPLALTTANGHVSYAKGEFIATFDQINSRSQFLVVNGDVEVANILDSNLKYTVSAGSFTMVDPEVENGVPRVPTRVGLESLDSALSEFKNLPVNIKENTTPTRSIASVEEDAPKKKAVVKKGEIIFIKAGRLPASVTSKSHKWNPKKVKSLPVSEAQINYYGVTPATPRAPASTIAIDHLPTPMATKVIDTEFEDSLKRKSFEQPKYPKELSTLIEDLKSY